MDADRIVNSTQSAPELRNHLAREQAAARHARDATPSPPEPIEEVMAAHLARRGALLGALAAAAAAASGAVLAAAVLAAFLALGAEVLGAAAAASGAVLAAAALAAFLALRAGAVVVQPWDPAGERERVRNNAFLARKAWERAEAFRQEQRRRTQERQDLWLDLREERRRDAQDRRDHGGSEIGPGACLAPATNDPRQAASISAQRF
jgi:hypothetical protein